MADGINLNISSANVNIKGLGDGLTPTEKDDKKLFNNDDQSELLKTISSLPENFRRVLSETLSVTQQNLFDNILSEVEDREKEIKANFEKPSDKIGDVKKLSSAFGTPALFLGSKIDDILTILKKPRNEAANNPNSPLNAAGVIILGSNIENSRQYIKDFQDLATFINNQKVPDIGTFEETQKRLDALTDSMKKSLEVDIDPKDSQKFQKNMSSVTVNIGQVIKDVIVVNTLSSVINFKKANKNADDLKQYLSKLGGIGEDMESFATGIEASAKAAKTLTKSMPFFLIGAKVVGVAKKFFDKVADFMQDIKDSKMKVTKTMIEGIKSVNTIVVELFKSSLLFSAIAPFALLGTLGLKATQLFSKGLVKFVDYINDNLDTKKIQKGLKAITSIVFLVIAAAAAMIICGKLFDISGKALLGALAAAGVTIALGFTLKLLGNMSKEVAKGIVGALLVTVFAGLVFLAMKMMGMITPEMTLNALVALGGFVATLLVAAVIGVVGVYALAALAIGVAAATLTMIFALVAKVSLKLLSSIDPETINLSLKALLGDGENKGIIHVMGAMALLAPVALGSLVAMTAAMPAMVMMVVFSACAKKSVELLSSIEVDAINTSSKNTLHLIKLLGAAALVGPAALAATISLTAMVPAMTLLLVSSIAAKASIDNLSAIEPDSIKLSIENIGLLGLALGAASLLGPIALAAILGLPLVVRATLMLSLAIIPFKLVNDLVGEEKIDMSADTGILGFTVLMMKTMANLALLSLMGPLPILGATFISVALLALMPSVLICSKIAKFFDRNADVNLVNAIYGDNHSKPTESTYGLISFLEGVRQASKILVKSTIDLLLGAVSAFLMSLVFSSLKKSVEAMVELSDASRSIGDKQEIYKFMELMGDVATMAGDKGILSMLKDAAKNWIGDKLGANTSDMIYRMVDAANSMKVLSDTVGTLNIEGISIFMEAMDKIIEMGENTPNFASRLKAIFNGLGNMEKVSVQIDGKEFSENMDSLVPGLERLSSLELGTGLNQKAKDIKSAIETIFSAKTSKNADQLISQVDRLTQSLEKLSKVNSDSISNITEKLGGVSNNYKNTSTSTLGAEGITNNNSNTNINIDNSNLEDILKKILTAIESLKESKSWTAEA
ncbi:MAG: hypothetical protein HUJ68_09705 [Clostridia bacterium]|nr:hypothetical protein [Clostridia bacterium]